MRTSIRSITPIGLWALFHCGGEGEVLPRAAETAAARQPLASEGLSPHFRSWLAGHGYGGYHFERSDLEASSFGGKKDDADPVTHRPVIFIHGNSDRALGTLPALTGWRASRDYFLGKGYRNSELYATTWGPADPDRKLEQYHSRSYLTQVRAFIEAVRAYTGAAQVDVISHSMGVTLARKAILGGPASDLADGGSYSLGPRLSYVATFVGIAGANQGLYGCYTTGPTTPACGATNGFYPGYLLGVLGPYGVSQILVDINASRHYEADRVYSIWSTGDELINAHLPLGGLVYGRYTSQVPGQDGEKRYSAYSHNQNKDLSAAVQFEMVSAHRVP